jgi:hypothetical protein
MKMRLYDLQKDYDYQTKKLMRNKPSDSVESGMKIVDKKTR